MGTMVRRHAGRKVADARGGSSLRRFLHALSQAKIPFLIGGMTAAVLQGVPVVTADVDFWIGARPRDHDKVLLLCHQLGAKMLTDHVVELPDGTELNFAYALAGLKSFASEAKHARKLRWMGRLVGVLSLEQLRRSKEAVGRPKDKAHLVYIESALKMKRGKGDKKRVQNS